MISLSHIVLELPIQRGFDESFSQIHQIEVGDSRVPKEVENHTPLGSSYERGLMRTYLQSEEP